MSVLNVPQPEFMEDEEISIFADAVGKFYQDKAPEKRVLKWREEGQVERGFWNEAGEAGLLGVSVPEEYGGHGGDFRHDMVVIDQQAKHGVEGFAASLHNTVILPYLVRHGTEEQKKKYLPKLVTGELVSAIAMTEPGVGSDLQSITTTALKDGNGYRINGAKTYISNGQTADFIIVVAKTDPHEKVGLIIAREDGRLGCIEYSDLADELAVAVADRTRRRLVQLEDRTTGRALPGSRLADEAERLAQLGEAVLGEEQAARRLDAVLGRIKDPAVDYVSVKLSAIYSQVNLVAFEASLETVKERLRRIYRASQAVPFIDAEGNSFHMSLLDAAYFMAILQTTFK